ncbi:hypothetical protein KUTeg_020005 [Tegillarca granosa]|uniref:Dynein heavy chain linker domain-containing protein n=1 Tax=Tegillarca granosa TaxID=220873 RepID=A0ABQ9EE68_TEGGR|nr:hypothetical protein KUTeg_020005 [Tegillarca granosa]
MAKKTESSQFQKLQQQLQKSFTIIQQSVKSWQEFLIKCKPELSSIDNLGEQYICCKEAPEYMIPMLNNLPDLKDKLLYKITTEINMKVEDIQLEMKCFKNVCDRVTKQCDYSMDLYRKHADTIHMNEITERTATFPSIVDMLEWIQNTERLFLQQYPLYKLWVDKSFTIIQQSVKSWQESLIKCKPELSSIDNLGEQYICCKEAPEYMIPMLNNLPDLKDKLLVTKQCDYSMDLYSKHADTIHMNEITERTATCPSMADMLEWIQDTERLLLQQYPLYKLWIDKKTLVSLRF